MKVRLIFLIWMCGVSLPAQDTGYPAGLMADCPGMNYTTTLTEATKSSAPIIVVLPNKNIFMQYQEIRCSLYSAKCVSKHINLRDKVTQVVISGYLDSSFSPLVRSIVARYQDMQKNVLVLEIFPILVRSYPLAARVTKPLGKLLGQFLAALTREGLSASQLEFTGGSLGAHISSYAAVEFYRLTGERPARITGLDPAGPCFRNLPDEERLHPGAAERVDVLHTNIDGFGIADPLGHVDFYANGGEFQPNMKEGFLLPCLPLCSHIRSALYYVMACKNPDDFIAVRCDSVAKARHGDCYGGTSRTNLLGPKTDFDNTGIFYLPTKPSYPYYLGKKGLKKQKYGVNEYLSIPSPDEDITL